MRDRGHWTLRCQSCLKDFTIELMAGEQVVDFVKSYACPHCKKRPDEAASVWHHVIDFQTKIPH